MTSQPDRVAVSVPLERSRAGREVARRHLGASPVPLPVAEPPTYYEQPALKASFYGWKVSTYMFVAGLAGSAQVLALVAQMAGAAHDGETVRRGRYLALAGAVLGAPLLIIDLHTPQRFYNMLRIFRPTSPMSIGTYVLTGFGGVSLALAAVQARLDGGGGGQALERIGAAMQFPAAALGAAMSTYTGALLGATSIPLWAAAPRTIAVLFGASAVAGGAAVLSFGAEQTDRRALGRIEALASGLELLVLLGFPRRLRQQGVRTPTALGPVLLAAASSMTHTLTKEIAGADRVSPWVDAVVAAGVIAGGFLLRHLLLRAGNRSVEQPRDYFRFARPR
jgi:formate-dependent nitrite reductase membrane component NrfD